MLTANVPIPLAEKVDAVAERLDRSRNWIVKQALAAWLEVEEQRHRMILEALAEGDAGQTVSHAAMQLWADSLGTDKPVPAPRA